MARLVTGPRSRRARTDDLDILHPERIVWIRGEQWTVREYSLLEAARLFSLGAEARRSIGENTPRWPVIVALMAVATGRGEYEIGALEDEDFDRVYIPWRDLNLPLFEATEPQPGPRLSWSDVYSTLIANGHPPERIGTYTARQIDLHYGAVRKRGRRAQAERISDVNAGFAGGNKAKSRIESLLSSTPR